MSDTEASPQPRSQAAASRPMSLRAWLFLSFALLSTLPFLVLSVGLAEVRWRERFAAASARLGGTAAAVALAVDNDLEQTVRGLATFGEAVEERWPEDGAALSRRLAAHHRRYPDFLSLVVTDGDGVVVASDPLVGAAGNPIAGTVVADRDYFRRPRESGAPFISGAFRGRGFGSDVLVAVSVPLRRAGVFAGVVEGSLDPRRYQRFIAPQLAREHSEILVLDAGGRVVAASAGSERRPLDRVEIDELETDDDGNGAGAVRAKIDTHAYLLARAEAAVPGWTVVVARPLAVVESDRRLGHLIAAGWTAFALALSLLLTWATSARIAAPLLASERRYRELVEQSLGLICTHDLEGKLLTVNPAAAEALGLTPEELAGRHFSEILHPEAQAGLQPYLDRVREKGTDTGLIRLLTVTGEERIWMYRNRLVETEEGPPQVFGHAVDVTASRRREQELAELALRDPLTGVANRTLFEDRLALAIERARRYRHRLALVYLDLDGFKEVNDRHGHAAGDAVLCRVAAKLQELVRRVDTVARLGGDEFAVLLLEIGTPENARRLAGSIRDALAHPIPWGEEELSVAASVGLGLFPDDAGGADELLAAADREMYREKRRHATSA